MQRKKCGRGLRALVVASVATLGCASTVQAANIHVGPGGNDANTGADWNNRLLTLQAALSAAGAGDQIFLAAGTYKPGPVGGTAARSDSFFLPTEVKILGGFSGTEDGPRLRSSLFPDSGTRLSGDIGTTNDASDNCWHVVRSVPNEESESNMHAQDSAGNGSSVWIRNSIIWENLSASDVGTDNPDITIEGSSTEVDICWSNVTDTGFPSGFTVCAAPGLTEVDPLFVNEVTRDYRLQSSSTMIDAGHVADTPDDVFDLDHDTVLTERVPDRDGLHRFNVVSGCEIDLGSYEYGTHCLGDFNESKDVGFQDLLVILGAWGPCVDCEWDLDGNDDIGFGDVLILLNAWGPCSENCGTTDDMGSMQDCVDKVGWSNPARLADCIEAMLLLGSP